MRELAPPARDAGGARAAATVAFHANVYESDALRGIDAEFAAGAASSRHRMARMEELSPAASPAALEAVISDAADVDYPIHRTPRATDPAQTLNSVLFDVAAERISVWAETAPTAADEPALTIDWRSMEIHAPAAR